jgi:hypothetical protein
MLSEQEEMEEMLHGANDVFLDVGERKRHRSCSGRSLETTSSVLSRHVVLVGVIATFLTEWS